MSNIAIILAGGIGTRISKETPKQLIAIGDMTMLEHTLSVYQESNIDHICVVYNNDYKDDIISLSKKFSKVSLFVQGGERLIDSEMNGIREVGSKFGKDSIIAIHSACRPGTSIELINNTIDNYERTKIYSLPILRLNDSILTTNGKISELNRDNIVECQEPCVCSYEKLIDLKYHGYHSITENYAVDNSVSFIEGSIFNIKVTYESDIEFIKLFLKRNDS